MPTRVNRARKDRADDISGPDEMAHFDDTKASLALRVARLGTGRAWAEDPPSRTSHLVTNVQATPLAGDGDSAGYSVRSAFLLYRNQGERTVDVWAGRATTCWSSAGRPDWSSGSARSDWTRQ